jgi:general stress protein YciG
MANRNQGTENRSFGSMDKEKQREISAKGGHASQGSGNSRNQSQAGSSRGGSSEQHSRAGRQSHKNS